MKCPCGSEIELACIPCINCSIDICTKCYINRNPNICVNCIQNELEKGCRFVGCNNITIDEICRCEICYRKQNVLKYCSKHINYCAFCDSKICNLKKVCKEHSFHCTICRKYFKTMFICIQCRTQACYNCKDLIMDSSICRTHKMKCGNGCEYYDYQKKNCTYPGCDETCCPKCSIYSDTNVCQKHIKFCQYSFCIEQCALHKMKPINWYYDKKELVCISHNNFIRSAFQYILLILNRHNCKFPKEILEKIVKEIVEGNLSAYRKAFYKKKLIIKDELHEMRK